MEVLLCIFVVSYVSSQGNGLWDFHQGYHWITYCFTEMGAESHEDYAVENKNLRYQWHFEYNLWTTISCKIFWEFRLFWRFSRFKVRTKKSILSYLFNLIEYFDSRGVDRLPGYILSLTGPFLSFWILRS